LSDNAQSNTQDGQEKPQSEKLYVSLPGHPFYGQLVKVCGRLTADTYTRCTIENPTNPNFHYQILERWLSATPPLLEPDPAKNQGAIRLSVKALDTMTQMILAKSRLRRDQDAPTNPGNDCPPLGTDSTAKQSATQSSAFLPGSETDQGVDR
jgi:hypothetical protein